MLTSNDFEVIKARNADIQRQAEKDHLAEKAAHNPQSDSVPAHKVMMAKVGKALVTIGSHLEAQGSVAVNLHGETMTPTAS